MFKSRVVPMLALATMLFVAVHAQSPALAEDVKLPQTAAEHEARAKSYRDQAAEFRKGAAEHKQMAAEYAKQHPDMKGSPKNAWTKNMLKHCQMLAKDFEKLAVDAEKAADFHLMRGKELQGG